LDRNRANSNLGAGLLTGAIALAVFGLVFFVAVVYIG
jgi:hypothetical protein